MSTSQFSSESYLSWRLSDFTMISAYRLALELNCMPHSVLTRALNRPSDAPPSPPRRSAQRDGSAVTVFRHT
eukprot:6213718-Pleurochrysis_carterae.AAC.1